MLAVNGNYIVKSEKTEQRSGAIFVAMDNTSQFVKCEIVHHPVDDTGIKIDDTETYKVTHIYTFKDKLLEINHNGEALAVVNSKDILALSN